MCPARRSPQWSALTAGKRIHLDPFHWECWSHPGPETKPRLFAKPVSENGSMEHFGLGLLRAKGHQRGFEKLGQNPSAGQGVKENVEQREKWENGSGCKHKGIFFLCSDVQGSQQLRLARSRRDRGIKPARGSIWDLPAERDQCARALLTTPLLSSSPLSWQLGRGETLEGKI